ncbi:MAG: CZB domain-containing protein [Actinobacteria bacterium]|nr:CZB domain-containing protein [Actinomycetota bacterium]
MKSNLSISKKLYLAFGAIIALMVIMSVVINITNSNLVRANKEIIKETEFESQTKTYQKQHVDWINALSNHILIGGEFKKTLNPQECDFGKWYYSYIESAEFKAESPETQRILKELEEPHRKLHEGGAGVTSELQQGRKANAVKYYEENTLPTITQLDGIYNELVKTLYEKVEQHKADAQKSERAGNLLIIVLTVMGALVGVAVAYLLTRSTLSMVGKVVEASENVANASDQISAGNQELSQRTQEQASALEETAATIEEMSATVKTNAESARRASTLAVDAAALAQNGGAVVEDTMASMGEVTGASKKIADIINVINEIAFQTNLLALNAAVEAARAGEQGKGFAVVAGEVRNLAQRSAEAAKEIQNLIQDSAEKVDKGNKLAEKSGETLLEIISSIKEVAETVTEIASASQEQATGIDQVNKAVSMMDDVVQNNSTLVEEAAAASQSLAMEAEELKNLMASFSGTNALAKEHKNRSLATVTRIIPRQPARLKAKAAGAEELSAASDDFDEF